MINACSLCRAECCKTYIITATAFDIVRLEEATGRSAASFAMLHPARMLSFDPDTTLDLVDESWPHVLGLKSHPCIFLAKGRCAVHGSAPLSCRRYPFQLGGKLNARFCPALSALAFRLKGPDIPEDGLKSELGAHKRIVEEWNRKPGRRAECMDFLISRARGASPGTP